MFSLIECGVLSLLINLLLRKVRMQARDGISSVVWSVFFFVLSILVREYTPILTVETLLYFGSLHTLLFGW